MWFERFVIIVTTLARDFLPGAWDIYHPTWVEIWTFCGSIGFFVMNFMLFVRFLPVIAIAEIKGVLPKSDPHYRGPDPRAVTEDETIGAGPSLAPVAQPQPA
jgi:molybdopterin-containing oxidoreductase family membrane subunit